MTSPAAVQLEVLDGNGAAADGPAPQSSPSGGHSHAEVARRWKAIGHKAILGVAVAGRFSTLHDTHGVHEILPSEIKLIKRLGKGAFAEVHKAEYTLPGGAGTRLVAVKHLLPSVAAEDPDELQAFNTECNLMRKLKHRYIVDYVGVGYNEGPDGKPYDPFLVQELMDGGSLKDLIPKSTPGAVTPPPFTNADAVRWLSHVASALAYLHAANPIVIHRDLKMDNVLLSADKQVAKLADFGLAGFARRQAALRDIRTPRATPTRPTPLQDTGLPRSSSIGNLPRSSSIGNLLARVPSLQRVPSAKSLLRNKTLSPDDHMSGQMGTLMYMAPEMYREESYTEKVDVYSFAVITYELFNRKFVIDQYRMGSMKEVEDYIQRVSTGARPRCAENIPKPIADLIRACWNHDPKLRPTMQEVADKLRQLLESGVPETGSEGCCCTIM